jgi:polar amino acid transport system permease protein
MWNWSFAFSILPDLAKAVQITIAATLAAFVLAVSIGLVLALCRRSALRPVAFGAQGLIEFIRSTPLLIQLYFIFYVLPEHGFALSPFTAGVIGLGLHYSAYLAEVYRSGIDAIPRGQWEAAKALNFTKTQTWVRVILPQAIRPLLPVMGNYMIVMFKETPILSAITLVELLQAAKLIGSQSFRYFEPFTMVGLFFLFLSFPTAIVFRQLESRLKLNQ